MTDAEHWPIDTLLFPEPVAGGMNYLVIASLMLHYRCTNEDAAPIKITSAGSGFFRIVDGRHRVVASMAAGRKTVLATYA